MEKKYISIDQLWKCETCFYMGSNGKCRSDCDAVESYRPVYSKFEFADVAPVVHGCWIDRNEKTWCSVCDASNKQYKPPYCPHCGAMMDGGK